MALAQFLSMKGYLPMETDKKLFYGVATALITPFTENGKLDLPAFRRLVALQCRSGVAALVVAGTTGEAPTLTDKEKILLLRAAKEESGGALPIIMGAGSNDTERACRLAKMAEREGADAILSVTPYYNKGTRRGRLLHYERLAEKTSLPIILYNVPSRTGVSLSLDDYAYLFQKKGIIGVKEAEDNLEKEALLCAGFPSYALYTGNDSHILPFLALGGDGVISVLSNLFPKETALLYRFVKEERLKDARALYLRFLPFIRLLFKEPNPAPIKYAMSKMALCAPYLRLPLTLPDPSLQREIDAALSQLYSL